jgi:hypothetical protein
MEAPAKYPYRLYFWMVLDERTGKLRKTRWRMSEAEAQARYPGAVRVEYGSLLIERPGEPHGTPKITS